MKFSRQNRLAKCRVCGKLTHSMTAGEMVGLELCRPCYEEALMENAHNDGSHETPNAKCKDCAK